MNHDESQCLGRIEALVTDVHENLPLIEKRVGSLERSRSYAKGAAAVCGALAVAVSSAVWGIVK